MRDIHFEQLKRATCLASVAKKKPRFSGYEAKCYKAPELSKLTLKTIKQYLCNGDASQCVTIGKCEMDEDCRFGQRYYKLIAEEKKSEE